MTTIVDLTNDENLQILVDNRSAIYSHSIYIHIGPFMMVMTEEQFKQLSQEFARKS